MGTHERDQEKTMRGLKITDTTILTGYQLFHNYFRSQEHYMWKPCRCLPYHGWRQEQVENPNSEHKPR